jgi:hypothetical protein
MTALKPALVQWEILRIPFNVILFTLGLMWSWPLKDTMTDEALFGYWGSVAAYGFTANVFFTLGPASEAYWLAFRGRTFGPWRWAVYGVGVVVSVLMTSAFVWAMEIMYIMLFPSRGT